MLKIESGNEFLYTSMAITLYEFDKKVPSSNPKPLLEMNSYTKFEENRSINAQNRDRKWSADGRTDGHSNAGIV